jgi:hypothetical protein
MKTLRILAIALFIVSVPYDASSQKKLDPSGSWTFIAEEAPEEYNSGDIVIEEKGEEFTAKIVFDIDYEIKATGVKYENNEISFKVNIEGEPIPIKGIVGEGSIEGTASTPDGIIKFIAAKKE